jgi:hypothetical protein
LQALLSATRMPALVAHMTNEPLDGNSGSKRSIPPGSLDNPVLP